MSVMDENEELELYHRIGAAAEQAEKRIYQFCVKKIADIDDKFEEIKSLEERISELENIINKFVDLLYTAYQRDYK